MKMFPCLPPYFIPSPSTGEGRVGVEVEVIMIPR